MALSPDERVTVGLVRGLHGLGGTVRVEVLSDDPSRFAPGSVLFLEGDDQPLSVAWSGPAKAGLLVRFVERAGRESVEGMRDRYLEASPYAPLPADTWYWHEIHGLEVRTSAGEVLGRVSDVFRAGAGEVYVVRGEFHGELLVPAVHGVVTELTPEEGHIIVDAVALGLASEAAVALRTDGAP